MSEKNKASTLSALEGTIKEKLMGEAQKHALEFIAYTQANGLVYDAGYATNNAHLFLYNGETVFLLGLPPFWNVKGWNIYLGIEDNIVSNGNYEDFLVDETLKEFAWSNVKTCEVALGRDCGCGKQPGKRVNLFGKEIENNCPSHVLWFVEPDASTLEKIFKLVNVWKRCIDGKQ